MYEHEYELAEIRQALSKLIKKCHATKFTNFDFEQFEVKGVNLLLLTVLVLLENGEFPKLTETITMSIVRKFKNIWD